MKVHEPKNVNLVPPLQPLFVCDCIMKKCYICRSPKLHNILHYKLNNNEILNLHKFLNYSHAKNHPTPSLLQILIIYED